MAGRAKVIGWDIEWTGTGLAVFRGPLSRITIETRKTYITIGPTCVILTVQTFCSDIIAGVGVTETLTGLTDAAKNRAIHPPMPGPAGLAGGAAVARWALANLHSSSHTPISWRGDSRLQADIPQPEDGIHPKAVSDLYKESLQVCEHCHELFPTDWEICAMYSKQVFFKR